MLQHAQCLVGSGTRKARPGLIGQLLGSIVTEHAQSKKGLHNDATTKPIFPGLRSKILGSPIRHLEVFVLHSFNLCKPWLAVIEDWVETGNSSSISPQTDRPQQFLEVLELQVLGVALQPVLRDVPVEVRALVKNWHSEEPNKRL